MSTHQFAKPLHSFIHSTRLQTWFLLGILAVLMLISTDVMAQATGGFTQGVTLWTTIKNNLLLFIPIIAIIGLACLFLAWGLGWLRAEQVWTAAIGITGAGLTGAVITYGWQQLQGTAT